MNVQFYFLLSVILISRLLFTFRDDPIDRKRTVIMTVLQIIGLMVFKMGYTLGVLAGVLIVINVVFHFLENKSGKIIESRLLSLLTHITALSIFFSPWVNLIFNSGLSKLLQSLGYYSLLFITSKSVDWLKFFIISLGLLFVINEANIMIRYLFQVFRLSPQKGLDKSKKITTSIDTRALNAGRIIGILERILVYYLVLNAQFAAIGFVLAAKSFARFKELDKREFAEYVLIGTLISMILAIVVAAATQLLLPSSPARKIFHLL